MDNWNEIIQCKNESRRELVLKGNEELKKRLADLNGELPVQLYQLTLLNFLEISSLELESLNERIGDLCNLSQLFLRKNKISKLPITICKLTSLKFIDVSENSITTLPEDIGCLTALHTLNLACNQLSSLPDSFSNLENLAVLNISQNSFCKFPEILCLNPISLRLADFNASYNQIDDISDMIVNMTMLKTLDFSDNQISELTQGIGKCLKLKQAFFKGNPLKDKRLKKLIEQNNSQKAILDYIRTKGRKVSANHSHSDKAKVKETRKGVKHQKVKAAIEEQEKELVKYFIKVLRLDESNDVGQPFRIIASENVKDVRPYVVGCLIKNLVLDSDVQFKSFITLQTKLHEDVCQKRTVATIATHDARLIPDSVVYYDAADPTTISVRPLGRHADVSALTFYQRLCKEADDVRKEKKRNQVSGIHKYLNMLKDKELFAFTKRISDNRVISLPPLTNSDLTKISQSTCDVFVEVTGNKSLNMCKSVLDELLRKMIELGFTSCLPKDADFYDDSSDEEDGEETSKSLLVQQVRVENEKGDLKVVYPSRTDLCFESKEIKVERI